MITLRTDSFNDMKRLISFVKKYDFIFEAGKVDSVYYTQGDIFLHPNNNIIDSLNYQQKDTNDSDSWVIIIDKDKMF